MKSRLVSFSLLALLLVAGTVPVRASSVTGINGQFSGLELCPQSFCGAAIFSGLIIGQVGSAFAIGTISVAATHESPLPVNEGQSVDIIDGVWSLRLLSGRRISGTVEEGSLLRNIGDDLFQVHVEMKIASGGSGDETFDGILSHQVFPPTLKGQISAQ